MVNTLVAGLLATSSLMTSFAPFTALFEPLMPDEAYFSPLESETAHSGEGGALMVVERPEVRLAKWNGEVNLGVSYDLDARAVHNPKTGVTTWDGGRGEAVEAYPLKPRAGMEDGGFEIEVVLDEVPESNRFEFPVDGHEDLEFHYQAPLSVEEAPVEVSSCTDTTCVNEAGEVVMARPEEIVGSYAVYHKEKRNHVEGQTNYASGKAFQIFRPKAKDANGVEAWGELSYADGVLAVTMPDDYLRDATYPVRVDPTFGYSSIGASTLVVTTASAALAQTHKDARFFTESPAELTGITIYGNSDSGTRDLTTVLYDYSDGIAPTTRMTFTQSVFFSTTPAWYSTSLLSETITTATTHVLAVGIYPGTGSITLFYDSVSNSSYDSSSSALPATWSGGTNGSIKFSGYATYSCDPYATQCEEHFHNPGFMAWTAPANVTEALVYCYGGGGGGGDGTNAGAGGGGGAAAVNSSLVVVPGTIYTIFVGSGGAGAGAATGATGSPGTDTTFATTSVVADGGSGGPGANAANSTGGAGGTAANSTGDFEVEGFAGGGGKDTGDTGGGGGGSGGFGASGAAAGSGDGITGGNGGTAANSSYGGAPGAGGNATNGADGKFGYFGAGGGGGGDNGFAGGRAMYFGGAGGGGENGGGSGGDGACNVYYSAVLPDPGFGPLPRVMRLFEGVRIKIFEGKIRILSDGY